ncbi:MAG: hypothetical protein II304_07430 [Bacteroidales bacterium]|nr:hypothetical protein [Bacteroidales bacterium]
MTIGELKELLSEFNDNDEIVIKSGRYAYEINDYIQSKTLHAFYGDDKDVLIIAEGEQIGGI